MSQGLKPGWLATLNVRTEVRTYLRSKSKDNSRLHYTTEASAEKVQSAEVM